MLSYAGLDGRVRETALSFEPAPTVLRDSVATYSLQLAPGAKRTIFVTVSSRGLLPQSTQSFFKGLVDAPPRAARRRRGTIGDRRDLQRAW